MFWFVLLAKADDEEHQPVGMWERRELETVLVCVCYMGHEMSLESSQNEITLHSQTFTT